MSTFEYQIPVTFSSAVSLATADESLNNLFSTRTYQETGGEPNVVTVVLTIDQTALKTLLVSSTWYGALSTGSEGCPTSGSAAAGNAILGNRLLEIMALKLFGHAAARAAILNDSAFVLETLLDDIIAGAAASAHTDRMSVFDQYTSLERYIPSENNVPVDFDFSNLKMTFPFYLDGTLPSTVTSLLKNKTGLGSDFSNGVYHIPISLLLDGSVVV